MCGKCLHCVGDVVRWYHIRSPTPTRLVWSCLFFLALISNTNYNSASVAQWHPQWTVTKHIPTWAVVSDCQPLVDSQASPALLALQASTLVPTYVLKVNWYKNIHFCCCCCVNSSGAGKECDWGGWEKLHKNILWTEEKKTKKKRKKPIESSCWLNGAVTALQMDNATVWWEKHWNVHWCSKMGCLCYGSTAPRRCQAQILHSTWAKHSFNWPRRTKLNSIFFSSSLPHSYFSLDFRLALELSSVSQNPLACLLFSSPTHTHTHTHTSFRSFCARFFFLLSHRHRIVIVCVCCVLCVCERDAGTDLLTSICIGARGGRESNSY